MFCLKERSVCVNQALILTIVDILTTGQNNLALEKELKLQMFI